MNKSAFQQILNSQRISLISLLLLTASLVTAQSFLSEAQAAQARDAGLGDAAYQQGLNALDSRNWQRAIDLFSESASRKGGNVDAALYWLAYAQNRAGEREDAIGTIRQLQQNYASSRWMSDAKALEVEIQGQNGEAIASSAEPDEDLKLLALNGLMSSDPQRAMPVLKKLLEGNASDRIKDRAMFVLVQNPSPDARKLLGNMARSGSGPALQMKAIRYLGMLGDEQSRTELASIYKGSSDPRVKSSILKSFMMSGSRGLLLDVARSETNPELRREAIRQLALTGGKDELWQLYQQESSLENKKAILQSMFLSGDSGKLTEIARSAREPELKMAAIKSLGLMGANGRGDVLVSIYQSDTDPEIRHTVLNALFLQQNAKALVDLARSEKDPHKKARIVERLSQVHSKEATDYLMEILK